MQTEEFSKSRDFELLANSGVAMCKSKRKRKLNENSERIEKGNQEQRFESITDTAFINRLVFHKNKIVNAMQPDEDFFEDQVYLDKVEEEEENIASEPLTVPRSQIVSFATR